MAGRVQIEAIGQLSDSLTVNPSFSFFTKRYSKYANYATENYKISFAKGVYTNDFLEVTIPQNCGDILQEVTLSFKVDPTNVANLGSNLSPIDIFGISVIDYVELYVGDQKIDTVTSDDIFIHRELNIPESYRSSLDVIHGKHFQGSSDREFLQEFYDGQFSTQGVDPFSSNEYRIQIPFYFHRRPSHGIPLCTIRKQELSLRIKLRPTDEVLFASQEKFGQTIWNPRANNQVTDALELSNFKVNLGLVHLDTVERCMLQSKPLDILFEQRQRNIFEIDGQSKSGNFRLDFKNCVKELFFIVKKTGKWTDEYVSILDQLRELDNYTDAQQTTLFILKLIPLWSGVIGNVLSAFDREQNETVRTEFINAVLNLFYWGTDDTYTSVLEQLKIHSGDTNTELARIATIQTYLNSIPGTILGIQIDATTKLNSLIGETDPGVRSTIIDGLLVIPNVWGPEQIGLLNALRYPGIPTEGLLIFGLRVYLTTISYYLTGLSQLKPGTPEQVATINKVTEILDNTKVEYDIIKFGLKAILDDIPGKTVYTRSRIVYAIIKYGTFTLGEQRAIWSETQLTQLNSLTIDPGSNATLIAQQRATIDSLIGFMDSVDDIKSYITGQLDALDGELNYDTRDDIVNNLLNLVNFYKGEDNRLDAVNPAEFWGQDQKDVINALSFDENTNGTIRNVVVSNVIVISEASWSETDLTNLNALKNSGTPLAGTTTEDAAILYLKTYKDAQTVSDSIYARDIINNSLDGIIANAENQVTRATLVGYLLAFDIEGILDGEGNVLVEARPYWDDATRALINDLAGDTLPDGYLNTHILTIRVYMYAVVYGLRLIIEGVVGSTGIEYTIDRLLTALDGETDPPTRVSIVNGLLAIPSVWRETEVNLLNALKNPGLPDEDNYILALRLQSNTLTFNVAAGIIPKDFPGASFEERIANVAVLRLLPVWEDTIIKLVNEFWNWTTVVYGYLIGLKTEGIAGTPSEIGLIAGVRAYTSNTQVDGLLTLLEGQTDQQTRVSIVDQIIAVPSQVLSGYLQGLIGAIPILKLRLNVLKEGVNGVLDNLPATAAERDPIIVGISTLHAWSDTQFYFLNALRTPSAADLIYINALKISTGSLDSLPYNPLDPNVRIGIVYGLLAIPNFWSADQTTLITALQNPANDATTIPALNALFTNVPVMTGYTQFDQNNVIDGIISQAIWGEKYFDLNDLRQIEPGFVGQATVISQLGAYLGGLPSSLDYIVDGIDTTLGALPGLGEQRTGIIYSLLSLQNIWSQPQIDILEDIRASSDNDASNIPQITGYIDGVIAVYDTALEYLEPTNTISSGEVDILKAYLFWGADQVSLLSQLETLVTTRLNTGGQVTDSEQYYKYVLSLYVKGIRFYWNLLEEGIATTVSGIASVTNSIERGILVGILLNFPIWGADQLTLLNELRTVDSKNHSDAVDAITAYLDNAYLAIYNPFGGPSGLLIDIQTPGTTSADLQDSDLKVAVWGGYFYYLVEALQNPAITTDTEAGIIGKLSTHINISQSSESRTNNLNFLIRQLLTTYPETIFNKWVRAKKNVPLMYSKQKYTTLECDGVQVLDGTTGSNMFLSASLPNLYHKRSPNFRNINMYSFALHPQELQPSGHLNFSTVKDANVSMELEYNGAHGTFDFNNNYIDVFNIDPIYFPKQVIIIAKSYNMMIIRNGEAQIIF